MRIGILGPLEVRDADGRSLPVGGARLRSLLIRLAIAGGDAVPVDRLAADLWPDEGPADAANAVQALVSRLRGAAGKDIVSLGPTGYRLNIPSGEIDAWAFEQAVTAARARLADGDHAASAEAFRAALRMWRGPALADVADAPFAAATIARLSELRLAAAEDRIDADLALGKGAELVPEVEELAGEHPLRERLRGQLMRALYAAGRQADALGVFEDTRKLLSAAARRRSLARAVRRAPGHPARRAAEEPGTGPSPGSRAAPHEPARSADELCGPGRGSGTGREPPPGRVQAGHAHGSGRRREDPARGGNRRQGGGQAGGRRLVRAAGVGPGRHRRAAGGADRARRLARRPGRSRQAGRPGAAGPARRGARSAKCRPGARQLRARPRRASPRWPGGCSPTLPGCGSWPPAASRSG